MRIVELITGGEPGGAQRHVLELIQHLASRGHRIKLLHGGGQWLTERVPKDVERGHIPQLVRNIDARRDWQALRSIENQLRDFRPDVVHIHSSKAGILGRLAATRKKIPAVYTAHGYVFQDPLRSPLYRWAFKQLEGWGARKSRALIVMTREDYTFARRYLGSRAYYIPNGVTLPGAAKIPRSDSMAMGFLGRLSPEKGLKVFLEAARKAPEWRWIVAGDGALLPMVTEAMRGAPQIRHAGWVQNVEAFFDAIDVLIQPSWKEGAPYSVLEALAFGIPVVATPVGAMGEMVGGVDSRLLFTPGDVWGLVKAAGFAVENRDALGAEGRRWAAERYRLDQQLQRTEQILIEAAKAR